MPTASCEDEDAASRSSFAGIDSAASAAAPSISSSFGLNVKLNCSGLASDPTRVLLLPPGYRCEDVMARHAAPSAVLCILVVIWKIGMSLHMLNMS